MKHLINKEAFLDPLQDLNAMVEKVLRYFKAKQGIRSDEDIQLLFSDLQSPTIDLVGHLIKLNGGHTKEFSWKEEVCLNTHLIRAGFGDYDTSNFLQEQALEESILNYAQQD